jgi:zinc protease
MGVTEHRLANGMMVLVQEDHRVPLVTMELAYDAGERTVAPNLHGLARLTSYLMLQQTKHVPSGEYGRLLARAGAPVFNDNVTSDGVFLQVTIPAHQLELPLWLWSDQMGFFARGDDTLLAGRRTVLEEQRRAMLEGGAKARLDGMAEEELLPPDHPYRSSIPGAPEAYEKLDWPAVLAFHDARMTPDHATLCIVGDVETTSAVVAVARYFAAIPRSAAGGPPAERRPVTLPGETQIDVSANVPTASVSLHWLTPAALTLESARLEVLARLLNGHRAGWLYWKLVEEKRIATNVGVWHRPRELLSELEVNIEGAPGRSPAQILEAFDASMNELTSHTVTSANLQGAIFEALTGRIESLDRMSARADLLVRYERLTGRAEYLKDDLERYWTLGPQNLRDTMTVCMPRDRRVVLLVTPDHVAPAGGERKARRFTPAETAGVRGAP